LIKHWGPLRGKNLDNQMSPPQNLLDKRKLFIQPSQERPHKTLLI